MTTNTTRPTALEAAFDKLHGPHGYALLNAVQVYAAHMREEADRFQADYDRIAADPELRAAQDRTLVTTTGIANTAAACRQSADQADKAAEAWLALYEQFDPSIQCPRGLHGDTWITEAGSFTGHAGGRCYATTYGCGCVEMDESADVEAAR